MAKKKVTRKTAKKKTTRAPKARGRRTVQNASIDRESFVVEVDHTSAGEFLGELSPLGKIFIGENTLFGLIVFRGHSVGKCHQKKDKHKEYELVSTAMRNDSKDLAKLARTTEVKDRESQVRAEAKIIHDFFMMADSYGLPLPEYSQEMRETLSKFAFGRLDDDNIHVWPPKSLYSLIGLARHYGLPTRLLDWSYDPFVAAYFAAVGAAKRASEDTKPEDRLNPKDRLVVWGYSLKAVNELRKSAQTGVRPPFDMVLAPAASNPNLHAQKGVFTLQEHNDSASDATQVDYRTFDDVMLSWVTSLSGNISTDHKVFYRFSLPVAEAGKLLWLLAKHFVTAGKVTPGYGGVVETLKESLLWTRFS